MFYSQLFLHTSSWGYLLLRCSCGEEGLWIWHPWSPREEVLPHWIGKICRLEHSHWHSAVHEFDWVVRHWGQPCGGGLVTQNKQISTIIKQKMLFTLTCCSLSVSQVKRPENYTRHFQCTVGQSWSYHWGPHGQLFSILSTKENDNLGKYAFSLSSTKMDEKINTTLIFNCWILNHNKQPVGLALRLEIRQTLSNSSKASQCVLVMLMSPLYVTSSKAICRQRNFKAPGPIRLVCHYRVRVYMIKTTSLGPDQRLRPLYWMDSNLLVWHCLHFERFLEGGD